MPLFPPSPFLISALSIGAGVLAALGSLRASEETIVKPAGTEARIESIPTPEALPIAVVDSTSPSVEVNPGATVSSVPKRFQYSFRLNLRAAYDDNIYLRRGGDRVGDYYFTIEPGLTIGFGDIVGADMNSIRLDYAPSIFLYGKNSGADAVQHLIRIDGHYHLGHLTATLAQDVQLLNGSNPASLRGATGVNSGPTLNVDAGGNTEVNIYGTRGTFSYDLTGKTFLSGGVNFSAYDYARLISSQTIDGNLFINYTYSPKLTVGLGGTLGYNWAGANNPNQIFEQANGRVNYQLSGKVSLDASFGVELRQFEGDARGGSHVSPVYNLGATYQPFDGTTVSLQGSRRTQSSAVLQGQDYTNTSINLSLRQRFLRRIYFSLSLGYERADYFNTVQLLDATRSDDYFFLQPAVDVTLTRYWTMGAYFLHRKDESSLDAFSFYDNQVGLRTSLTF